MSTIAKAMMFVFLILGTIVSNVHAAKLTTGTILLQGEKIRFIKLEGEIEVGDTVKLDDIVSHWEDSKTPVEVIILNSRGGDVDESYELVEAIEDYELSTMVPAKQKCLSACVAVFAAGVERILTPESIIGVHRAHAMDGDKEREELANIELIAMYEELDVPRSIRLKAKTTPSDKVYYLTVKEKRQFSSDDTAFEMAEKKKQPPTDINDINDWILNDQKPVSAAGQY